MKYEDAMEIRDVVDRLYWDFEWYNIPSWKKQDVSNLKTLVRDLNDLIRKLENR